MAACPAGTVGQSGNANGRPSSAGSPSFIHVAPRTRWRVPDGSQANSVCTRQNGLLSKLWSTWQQDALGVSISLLDCKPAHFMPAQVQQELRTRPPTWNWCWSTISASLNVACACTSSGRYLYVIMAISRLASSTAAVTRYTTISHWPYCCSLQGCVTVDVKHQICQEGLECRKLC